MNIFKKKDLNDWENFVDSEKKEKVDENYDFTVSKNEAYEIASESNNLNSDFCKNDNRNITYLRFNSYDTNLFVIDNTKYWKVQIIAGDISWIEYADEFATNYDGFLIEEDLEKLCCLINVETGEYKYFPRKEQK